ncbi:Thioredoxin-like fold-containing protein [Desulfonema magnum]|uniref:Thioredoxin-like fold-containing protein n=2 Tax=Desulfonema magnum TaxID=45655 RepID=A0A975BQM4_9BACT|nr:Thioredoxin-like fold-containing protein [Desulfonema magnum]
MAIYKHQHIRPVDDPKDSPLFRETLNRSLNKFKQDEIHFNKNDVRGEDKNIKPRARPLARIQRKNDIKNIAPPQKGPDTARITFVVFTDFKCVHCSDWAKTLDEIMKAFPNDVRLIFKNFPLRFSKDSELAAKAALAAREQGKFWEMHDLLFKNRDALERENLITYARILGMNVSEFQKSLEKKALADIVQQERTEGERLGIEGAPTSFINGKRITGAKPFSYVKKLIKDITGGTK